MRYCALLTLFVSVLALAAPPVAVVIHGTAYAPAQAVANAVGATLVADARTGWVTFTKGQKKLVYPLDSFAILDENGLTWGEPAQRIGEVTHVALREVAEHFDGEVGWDTATGQITIRADRKATAFTVVRRDFSPAKQKGIHPIICSSGNFLVGGTAEGRWLTDEEMAPHLRGGEEYRVYGLSGPQGTRTAARPREEPGAGAFYVGPEELPAQAAGAPAGALAEREATVGIRCPWDPLPRAPKVQSTKQQPYLDAVHDILKAHGLPDAPVWLTQVIRCDLEGDGVDEVLLTAAYGLPWNVWPDERNSPPGMKSGPEYRGDSYSFVALRKVVDGRVVTTILRGIFVPGALLPANGDGNPPIMCMVRPEVAAVLDVDGDGVQEVVLWQGEWESEECILVKVQGMDSHVVLAGWAGA